MRSTLRRIGGTALAGTILATTLVVLAPPTPAGASLPVATRLVSRRSDGTTIPGTVSPDPTDVAISGNGRFVAFVTTAALVAADTNGKKDVYVRDRWAATTELVSMTDDEKPVADDSHSPSLSDDGRFVTFLTKAANLIPNDDLGRQDAFVRDRYEGTTRRVAIGLGGSLLNNEVSQAIVSGEGFDVVFTTSANNVVASDSNNSIDVFVRDLLTTDTIERVSLSALDGQASASSTNPTISDDGRYVAFDSQALLAGGVVGETNTYVRDRVAGTTELVSLRDNDVVGDHGGSSPAISGNGRKVVFSSTATNLVAGDGNGEADVFVRDLVADTTTRVSLSDADAELPNGANPVPLGISDDGSVVLFSTVDQATSATDAGGDRDVFTRRGGVTHRVTTGPSLADPAATRHFAAIDDAGLDVAFAHNLRLTAEQNFDQAYVNGPVLLGPLDTSSEFIHQQHQDFLGRTATAAELSTWSTRFSSGASSPTALIAALSTNPTFAAKRAPLVRLYWAFFLRRPDAGGLTFWLKRYQAGSSLTTIAQSFATSSEFKNRYGNVGNQQYVKLVYQNVFERQPDGGGLAFWTGKLDRKEISRGALIVQFSESSEGKRRLAGPTNITLISLAMLRNVPGPTMWNALYPTIDRGEPQSAAWVAQQLLNSATYELRFD